jgi:hypothetical protein
MISTMDVALTIQAFLMVLWLIFLVVAFVLLSLGLVAIVLHVTAILGEACLNVCYWLVSELIHGIFNLSGNAANIAQRLLIPVNPSRGWEKADDELPLAGRLLTAILSDEDREHVIGDMSEEYQQFSLKKQADLWLYKQVLKSVLPLAYKNLKRRLASYFGERVR